ncbi:DUF1559 family PulG-like putative transporter [Paludisphaera rhizosphaerae]|uniref:DUF1559 family PulG-like putative transporter n=1 Tax=Paludisphaera rhizosphaerae TaxID=2711216 RepID=UPI0013ED368F|nr:DUF1559 domain-containing protein [Paludisphaera rhizosphaerae]
MRRRAMTLIELMVVVFIVALTFGLVIPALSTSHCGPGMRWAQCANNIRNLALAAADYSTVHGVFPASTTAWPGRESNHSWTAAIFQDLDRADLYNAYNFDVPNYDPANSTVFGARLPSMICPDSYYLDPPSAALPILRSDGSAYPAGSSFAPGSYAANWGGGRLPGFGDDFAATRGNYRGVMIPPGVPTPRGVTSQIRPKDVVDGLATTILIGEKRDSQGWAVGGYAGSEFDAAPSPLMPDRPDIRTVIAGSFHPGGVNFAFADGSVRYISGSIDRKVEYALLTRDGGEAVSRDDY